MRATLTVIAATAIIGLLVYFLWASEGLGSRRFRLEVAINADGRAYSGSTVWQQTTESPWNPFPGAMYRKSAKGEAIAIPLSSNAVVFILKRHDSGGGNPDYGALLDDCGVYSPREVREFRGGCELRTDGQLVVLASGDMHSATLPRLERIDARHPALHKVSVVSVRIEVTDDAVTRSLAQSYPWLVALPNTGWDVREKGYPTTGAGRLYGVDFVSH